MCAESFPSAHQRAMSAILARWACGFRSAQPPQIERDFRDLAGRKSDDQIPAAPGQRPNRRLRKGSADRIVDDVDALGVRGAAQRVLQVLLLIIDGFIRTMLARE